MKPHEAAELGKENIALVTVFKEARTPDFFTFFPLVVSSQGTLKDSVTGLYKFNKRTTRINVALPLSPDFIYMGTL